MASNKIVEVSRDLLTRHLLKFALALVSLILLAGCSGSGRCPGTKGANCKMLSEVDRMIDNGEIEQLQGKKDCRGRSCQENQNKPPLANNDVIKVKLLEQPRQQHYQEGGYLYAQ